MLTPEERSWLDQENSHVARIIREYGWYVQAVLGDRENPSFAYSVGLFGMGHPELVVAGLAPHTMQWIINEAGARVRDGEELNPGDILDIGDPVPGQPPLPAPRGAVGRRASAHLVRRVRPLPLGERVRRRSRPAAAW